MAAYHNIFSLLTIQVLCRYQQAGSSHNCSATVKIKKCSIKFTEGELTVDSKHRGNICHSKCESKWKHEVFKVLCLQVKPINARIISPLYYLYDLWHATQSAICVISFLLALAFFPECTCSDFHHKSTRFHYNCNLCAMPQFVFFCF
jgi:hypothetical protein